MAALYNVRKKTFPDGTIQYMWHQFPDQLEVTRAQLDDPAFADFTPGDGSGREGEPAQLGPEPEADKARSQAVSKSRSKQEVYDLAKSNIWTYFLTLTFDPFKVDSFDYDEVVKNIVLFTRKLRDRRIQYVLVPEQHKSGAWHCHGVLWDPDHRLGLTKAISPYTGKPLLDIMGRQMYNCNIYDLGFSTVTEVEDQTRVSGYLCKYISKDLAVPEGRKRYWSSRGLQRPEISYLNMPEGLLMGRLARADYSKTIESDRGKFYFYEYHPREEGQREQT